MKERWTAEQAWEWYHSKPWITGFNFIPKDSISGIELFQEWGHEEAMAAAEKEIELAESLGFNSVRMMLPFYIWRVQHDAFMDHLEELLCMLDRHHITLMPILFNDCSVPKSKYREPDLGKQPDPVPGYFGGSPVTPFDDDTQLGDSTGWNIDDDPEMKPVIEKYVKELGTKYGKDPRIIVWNIWNEPGNSGRLSKSLPMMENVFAWMRSCDPDQPLAADVWGAGADHPYGWLKDPHIYAEIEHRALELSDVISFHFYGDYSHAKMYLDCLKQYNRPLFNTEWMHRPYRSLIETHMPLWKKEDVASYFFGFVNGKSQFNYVWEFIKNLPDIDTRLWMHDIFHSDFTPYDPDEIEVIKKLNFDK